MDLDIYVYSLWPNHNKFNCFTSYLCYNKVINYFIKSRFYGVKIMFNELTNL